MTVEIRAKNQWGSPKAIYDRLVSDNIVLDGLVSLHKKRAEVKIMYISSTKDVDFTRYQSWIDRREMKATKEGGVKFFRTLQRMCADLQHKITNIGSSGNDKSPATNPNTNPPAIAAKVPTNM